MATWMQVLCRLVGAQLSVPNLCRLVGAKLYDERALKTDLLFAFVSEKSETLDSIGFPRVT